MSPLPDDDLGRMPAGWSVKAVGRWVEFEVPASGVDGLFRLTHAEALAAGVALVRASEHTRVIDYTEDDLAAGYAQLAIELREESIAEDSNEAVIDEDQAWVDDISEFNEVDYGTPRGEADADGEDKK
jgi:hypothetical protein